jgi:replicative superfamily II helicase
VVLQAFHAADRAAVAGLAADPLRTGCPDLGPTGSGKTLAAFRLCIDELVRAARAGSLPDRVEMIYVSPFKGLSNDVQKNLETPPASLPAEKSGLVLSAGYETEADAQLTISASRQQITVTAGR